MKNLKIFSLAILGLCLTACNNDDDNLQKPQGKGPIEIKFDNSFNGDDISLNSSTHIVNGESLKFSNISYIIANITLIDKEGKEFIVPKEEAYFVINEAKDETRFVQLKNVDAADYKQLKFGLGVDQEKYLLGASGQGNLLIQAEENNMMWSWQAGYRFLKLEGDFTTANKINDNFKIHLGSHGSKLDNYREVTVNLPSDARVRTDKKPSVHVVVNIAKTFNAKAGEIKLEDKNIIMIDPNKSPIIADNSTQMFSVHHVHND